MTKTDQPKQIPTITDFIKLVNPDIFHKRLKKRRHLVKSFKAKSNESRSISAKIADTMTSRLGSMSFLILNALWFGIWLLLNTEILPGVKPFDPYPFGMLTTLVSLEAIFLSIVVLITQNRSSKIDDVREEINLQLTAVSEGEISKMIGLQLMILKKYGIDLSEDKEIQDMLMPTNQSLIERSIEKELS